MHPLDPTSNPSIAWRIAAYLLPSAKDARVADVRIGLSYAAVKLADRRTGVAFTFRAQARRFNSVSNSERS